MPSEPCLPLIRLMLTFVAIEPVGDLPRFRGALWRGVFGRALRRLSDPAQPLADVWPADIATIGFGPYGRAGLYDGLFAPEDGAGAVPQHLQVPSPFVIDALPGPDGLDTGETELIGLTLIGERVAEALPALLAAFRIAGEDGLGGANGAGRRGRMHLVDAAVTWRDPGGTSPILSHEGHVTLLRPLPPPVPPMPRAVAVTLAAPLRLMRRGLVAGPDDLTAGDLLEALVRRISTLQRAHGSGPIAADFRALFAAAHAAPTLERDLWFVPQTRWSGSQGREIEMGGVVGSFVLPLVGLEALWPYLWLGQWVHAGKGTVHGLGAIRLG
jgi:hypothetical protein